MGSSKRPAFMTDVEFGDLDDDARRAILSVADAVSAAAGHAAGDARRAAVRTNIGNRWKQGGRLPLDLVSAGFDAACV